MTATRRRGALADEAELLLFKLPALVVPALGVDSGAAALVAAGETVLALSPEVARAAVMS